MARIAVVGLGALGQGIARRFLKQGHTVIGFNRTRAKAQALASEGLIVAETLGDVVPADVLINVLWDDAAVEELLLPRGEVFSNNPGLFHIAVATLSVPMVRRLAEAHRALGQSFLAAPVLGRPDDAVAGKLAVLAAGPVEALDRARPILECLGSVHHLGEDVGIASAAKIAANFLLASAVASLREATQLVNAVAGNRKQFIDIMTAALLPGPFYGRWGGVIAAHDPARPAPNPFLNGARLAEATAQFLGLTLPVAHTLARGSETPPGGRR
ncbi:MAG: NAD(P)-dependent oxidoreductase [Alphaproteobacteria bacterium]|nr:NAD(P)-dependent oxidoreductase [Alphaproteobacteria bacterium]